MLEFLTAMMPYILGPAGALIVTVLMLAGLLWAGWKVLDKWLLPLVKNWLEKQEKHLENLMTEHKEDRDAFLSSINLLSDKIDKTDRKVEDLADDVKEIKIRIQAN